MSFATSVARFAAQAATARASVFAGPVDSAGYNIQIGDRRLTLAFSRLTTYVDMVTHGRRVRCTAAISIPDSLDLVPDETTRVIHLPTGDLYEVLQTGIQTAAAAEKRYLLHRLEP